MSRLIMAPQAAKPVTLRSVGSRQQLAGNPQPAISRQIPVTARVCMA